MVLRRVSRANGFRGQLDVGAIVDQKCFQDTVESGRAVYQLHQQGWEVVDGKRAMADVAVGEVDGARRGEGSSSCNEAPLFPVQFLWYKAERLFVVGDTDAVELGGNVAASGLRR